MPNPADPRRYGSRLRSIAPGDPTYSPLRNYPTGNRADALPGGRGGQVLRLPPADVQRQSPSGATLKTLSGGVGAAVPGLVEQAYAEAAQLGGLDYVALADQIALRLERALVAQYDGMRYATFQSFPFVVGTTSLSILQRPVTTRVYLFLINTHPINDYFVAFDRAATGLDVPIRNSDGFFEWLFLVPQNIINIVANAAGTTGALIFAELDPRAANKGPSLSSPAPMLPRM